VNVDRLKKWNIISIVIIVVFCIIHFISISAITYSAFNNTILSEAPDVLIKIIGFTPIIVMFIAILVRTYCVNEIRKSEIDGRIKKLEDELARLKGK